MRSQAGGGARRDWFYFVNGIEADTGAAEREVHGGDRVWWDYRDWSAAMRVPAVVGSYPEPFLHGSEGKRFPVRIDCARDAADQCDAVRDRLDRAGVETAIAALGTAVGQGHCCAWSWAEWDGRPRATPPPEKLEDGTGGERRVRARPRPRAERSRSTLLDAQGRVVRTLGPGAGHRGRDALRGAAADLGRVRHRCRGPRAGRRAARPRARLRDRFAVAASGAPEPLPLPVRAGGERMTPSSRPTATPARRCMRRAPGVAAAFALAPCVAALVTRPPADARRGARVRGRDRGRRGRGAELRSAARLAVPLALLVAAINPLVSREGLTLLVQGPGVPLLRHARRDARGGGVRRVAGAAGAGGRARVRALLGGGRPGRVLRGLRRVAPRSALTASLATRMVPLLARDAERMREAYGLRADAVRRAAGGRGCGARAR